MNEKNIANIYENNNFELKQKKILKTLDFRFDLFSVFLTSGAPETPHKNLTFKKLIDAMLDSNFSMLSDDEQCAYFQEFHNRIAKHYRFPAINVYVLPKQPDDSKKLGSVGKRAPLHYFYNTNGEQFDNIQLNIDNKINRNAEIVCVKFTPSSVGVENIMTILHESRHVAQFYAQSVFMQNNQILAENELNAVSYLQLLENVVSNLTGGKDLTSPSATDPLYPKIKNKNLTEDYKGFLSGYKLLPAEIDARKFALEEMDRLADKGFLDKTNWETYKGAYLVDEFSSLNLSKTYSQDVCPTINVLKERKALLDKNLDFACRIIYGNTNKPKELINIEKSIDFNRYFSSIQKFYDNLKSELRYIMVQEAQMMKESLKTFDDEPSLSIISKLENGAEQIYDVNGLMKLAVADMYTDNHKPIPEDLAKVANEQIYYENKNLRQKRMQDKMMKDIQENEIEEQPLDPDYEFERE